MYVKHSRAPESYSRVRIEKFSEIGGFNFMDAYNGILYARKNIWHTFLKSKMILSFFTRKMKTLFYKKPLKVLNFLIPVFNAI